MLRSQGCPVSPLWPGFWALSSVGEPGQCGINFGARTRSVTQPGSALASGSLRSIVHLDIDIPGRST